MVVVLVVVFPSHEDDTASRAFWMVAWACSRWVGMVGIAIAWIEWQWDPQASLLWMSSLFYDGFVSSLRKANIPGRESTWSFQCTCQTKRDDLNHKSRLVLRIVFAVLVSLTKRQFGSRNSDHEDEHLPPKGNFPQVLQVNHSPPRLNHCNEAFYCCIRPVITAGRVCVCPTGKLAPEDSPCHGFV